MDSWAEGEFTEAKAQKLLKLLCENASPAPEYVPLLEDLSPTCCCPDRVPWAHGGFAAVFPRIESIPGNHDDGWARPGWGRRDDLFVYPGGPEFCPAHPAPR